MKRQRVTYAKLHASFFIPGLGELKNTLPPDNKTFVGFCMWRSDVGGLILEASGKSGSVVAEIPSANIVGMVLGAVVDFPDEPTEPSEPLKVPAPKVVPKK